MSMKYFFDKILARPSVANREGVNERDDGLSFRQLEAEIERGNWEQARDLCEVLARSNNLQGHMRLSTVHLDEGDFVLAREVLNELLELDPGSIWGRVALGKVYMAEGRITSAVGAFREALAYGGDDAWLHFHLGEALVKNGLWVEGQVALHKASQDLPEFPWVYFHLAEARLALGDLASAKQLYRRAENMGLSVRHGEGSVGYVDHLADQTREVRDFVALVGAQDERGPRERALALMITPSPPFPPSVGVAQRMFHEMRALGERTDLVVASLMYEKRHFELKSELRSFCKLPVLVKWGDRPPHTPECSKAIHDYSSKRFTATLRELSRARFDIVVTDFIYMAQYRNLFPRALHVLSEHNIESRLMQRNAELRRRDNNASAAELELEARRLETVEDRLWPLFPIRFVVSEEDGDVLATRCASGETWVIRNGYDVVGTPMLRNNPQPRVLFVGTLNYWPNIDAVVYFVEEIMPLLWKKIPAAELWVAGAEPTGEVEQHCLSDTRIRLFANPSSIAEVSCQCGVSIVPLRTGSGSRIKILESLSLGLPTVTTSLGCEGLEVEDEHHLLIRDEPNAFAEAIVGLLSNDRLREKLRRRGRNLVESRYDWTINYSMSIDRLLDHRLARAARRQANWLTVPH